MQALPTAYTVGSFQAYNSELPFTGSAACQSVMQTPTSYWIAACGNTAGSVFVNGALVNMQLSVGSGQWYAAFSGLPAGESGFRALASKVLSGVFTLFLVTEPAPAGTTFLSKIYFFNTASNSFGLPAILTTVNGAVWRGIAACPFDPAINPTPSQAVTPSYTPSAPVTPTASTSLSSGVSPLSTPSSTPSPSGTPTQLLPPDANNLFLVRCSVL